MVEISECQVQNGHPIKLLKGKISSDKCWSAAAAESVRENGHSDGKVDEGDRLPEPDLELVAEVRRLLKEEWGSDLDESERIYSKYHYEEIMESGAPNTCWRYLIHMDLDVKATVELIKTALIWRKDNKIDDIQAKDLIKDIWLRAPIGVVGKSKSGQDIFYAVGKNYRKPDPLIKQTVRDFVAYILFEWDRKHRYDLDQMIIIFDVSDTGFRNIDLDFASWLVSIRDFVPARVKALYFIGIPFIIRPIIRLIISWLPERYRRITYCGTFEDLVNGNIDKENQPEEVGGLAANTWRLAPPEASWAHEIDGENGQKIYAKICEACSFNTKQEKLDQLYKMQREYEAAKK